MKYLTRVLILLLALAVCTDLAYAQRRGGGGRGGGRGGGGFSGGGFSGRASARPSINHRPMARPSPRPSVPSRAARPSQQPRRDLTPNRDVNRNINRDVNIDRDWDVDNGWGYNGCCHVDHPIAATAAVVGAAAVGASLGSTVYTLPPSCTTVVVDGIAYNDCNGVYYQPQFVGTTTQYVVVSKP